MILLIAGSTHTGKTALAQRLLERYHIPYLSIDHLKMGLIRSQYTKLTPSQDEALCDYLSPILKEIIKTNLENEQNLIIEGCYIPFDWQKDFSEEERAAIHYLCLTMSEGYIKKHQADILAYENIIEKRKFSGDFDGTAWIAENQRSMELCKQYQLEMFCFDETYDGDALVERCGKWLERLHHPA